MGLCIRKCGVRFALRAGLLTVSITFAMIVPAVLNAAVLSTTAGVMVCVFLNALGNAASATASTACFAATNNACYKHPQHIGSVNGVHVTFEAIGKMLGPAIGAPLLGTLLKTLRPTDELDVPSSFNGAYATLVTFSAASLLCFVGSIALPITVDGPKSASLLRTSSRTRSDQD
jgi:hypothetical protein